MKYFYLLVLLIIRISHAQNVNIPDANFKNALIELGFDINNDGEIQVSEAEAVSGFKVSYKDISSLEGIQSFINLEWLFCDNNFLTSLDFSQNPNLEILYCDSNELTSLDVSQNPILIDLYCRNNELTSLDVSQNPILVDLSCHENQLTNLDVSQNPNLEWLICRNNLLTNLDVSQNPNLELLYCQNNQLSSLNINNENNLILNSMSAFNNPNLNCIQVDDIEYANNASGWLKDITAVYSEDCSLIVQDYNQISLILFPNPAQDILNINSQKQIKSVKLYSISGALVKDTKTNSINVSELPSGLYFANISIDGKMITKKFIKK